MKTLSRFSPILGMLLVGFLTVVGTAGEPTKALPALGLTRVSPPRIPNQNQATYPNGKILVAERAPGGQRYVLVPVTIANCWDSVPLYSFQFSVEYDGAVLQAIGVQKNGPAPLQNLGLAKDFHLTFWDTLDTRPPTGGGVFTRQVTITGSSSTPLALTTPPGNDCRQSDTLDFLYIRFLVKAISGQVPSSTVLRIPNDTLSLFWNDYTPKKLFPVISQLNGDIGLGGPDSIDAAGSVSYGGQNISGRGRANLVVTKQPGLDLSFGDADVAKDGLYDYSFTDYVYADSGSTAPRSRLLDIIDSVADTRIANLALESDAPWLFIGTNPFAGQRTDVVTLLDYTSNALLRSVSRYIICDPTQLSSNAGPVTAGAYDGTITFSHPEAGNTPTKLHVRFIYMRNPLEPSGDPNNTHENSGIHILVQNSKSVPDSAVLTFGTGDGATDEVDTLFGEREFVNSPASGSFFARWFPDNTSIVNGLGDVGDVHTFMNAQGTSRDIRAYNPDSTIKYHCIFSVGNPNNYPVVLMWDVTEFPQGSRVMLHDTLNGSRFAVDMRKSTGGTIQSFTIRDRDISSFIVEYTPGTIAQMPDLAHGWNLVSLPVVAPDPRVITVYPNALNNHTAFLFFQSDYQQVTDLDFGRGYFVKWGNIITNEDKEVAGVKKLTITQTDVQPVTLSDGWNAIGSISVPTNVIGGLSISQRGNTVPKILGQVYTYDNNRGYRAVSLINPGRGYWLNIKGDAYLEMSVANTAVQNEGPGAGKDADVNNLLNKITLRDNGQREADVFFGSTVKKFDLDQYAMPPVPPAGAFDVRFATDRQVEPNVGTNGTVLRFQAVDYPVVLSSEMVRGNYVVTDMSGKVLGEFVDGQAGDVTITNRNVHAVRIAAKASTAATVPANEELTQNYPNPFNPTTDFYYSVPSDEFVTITVVNAVGQDVMQLVNGNVKAGTYKVTVDASKLPSGIYYYKMNAGSFSATRKMILTK